eukprot:645024-Amphidinium_carterae.1
MWKFSKTAELYGCGQETDKAELSGLISCLGCSLSIWCWGVKVGQGSPPAIGFELTFIVLANLVKGLDSLTAKDVVRAAHAASYAQRVLDLT